MPNPKFLVEFELTSIGVFEDADELEFSHPHLPVTITLREKEVDLNEEYAIIAAYVVLEADSLEDGSDQSEEILSDFLHSLKLVTSLDLQIYYDRSSGSVYHRGSMWPSRPWDHRAGECVAAGRSGPRCTPSRPAPP